MRNVLQKSCRETRAVYETMWKNTVQPGRPQMTIWRMRIACWDTYGYQHTHRICHTYCWSTVTMVARTGLNVTLYVHRLSCWDTCHHAVFFVTKISLACGGQQCCCYRTTLVNTYYGSREMSLNLDLWNNWYGTETGRYALYYSGRRYPDANKSRRMQQLRRHLRMQVSHGLCRHQPMNVA
jgi:hypothetical protein